MANPLVDGATAATASNLGKFVYGDGLTNTFMMLAYHLYYDGANWKCDAAQGMFTGAATVEAGLSWDATDDELDIDLSGLTRKPTVLPAVIVSATKPGGAGGAAANYMPQADASSATDIHVRFYDDTNAAGDPTQVTTEDTKMDIQILIVGFTS
jgi:hypothetical protein